MFSLPSDDELDQDTVNRLKSLPAVNIFRLLAKSSKSFNPWLDLCSSLYSGQLDGRLREIAICRQAFRADCVYELHQHKFIASQNNVTAEEFDIITTEEKVISLDDEANFMCQLADEIECHATFSDESLEALHRRYPEELALEIILLLSFYCSLARTLNCARVPIESSDPIKGRSSPV